MIYDVRQSTIYNYDVPGRLCAPRAAADADRPRASACACRGLGHHADADRAPRRPGFLRQPDHLDRVRPAARHADGAGRGAHRRRAGGCGRAAAHAAVGRGAQRPPSPPPISSPQAPAHFLFPSRQVSLDPEIRDYAALSFPPGRPILDGATDLMNRIKAEFVYELGATTASTTPPMSFALRRGVCQDFTHIMISGMRSLGLPVAYVSGYLRTVQSPRRNPARRRRRHARLGAGLVRRRRRAGSASIRPTPSWPATITSCWRSAATTPTWRRSTASSSPPARSGWRCSSRSRRSS